jgi:hypothetical protein
MIQEQLEMKSNHLGGATGVVVSGIAWLISAFVAYNYSSKEAIWTLLIGGAFIYPISSILNKLLGANRTLSKKILKNLAMEGTIFMLMCIPLAYGLSLLRAEYFFQGMLLIIGGRYLTFKTLFGNRIFWILGSILGMTAYFLFLVKAETFTSAIAGAIIEISFGLFIYINYQSEKRITL